MLTGVVVIKDTDGRGEVDPGQLPDPNGPVAQEHNDLGLGDAAPNGLSAQARAKLLGRDNIGNVSRRIIVTLGALVGFVGLAVRENGSNLYLAGAGLAVLAFAPSEL